MKKVLMAVVMLSVVGSAGVVLACSSCGCQGAKAQDDADAQHVHSDAVAQDMEGVYKLYDKASFEQSADTKRVLFFHADWCGACVAADKTLAMGGAIPEGVTVLKVDYSTAGELKKTHGVTMQDTFVQVDKSGKKIAMWVGVSGLAENIQ